MKTVKTIKIDAIKCTGCRACEMACSAFHAEPKYSITNPKRSRVRVFCDEDNDLYVPVFASAYTEAECNARNKYIIEGKEYDECSFCGVSCPWRDLFKEPDSGLPLKCDSCLQEPPLEEPLCVTCCVNDALIYEEREEEEEEEEVKAEEKEIGVEYLVKKYGLEEIRDILDRMSKS
ncbi:MAG: (4Fe-4S)-binding protein [Deltaproteobacteria bacterium]|nr:(4Fe-4S)-binding protein [Deltaproteobacteria bacterium]